MDSVSPEDRSRIMASIRGRDTEPERLLRSALHRLGFRFRVDARDLPGRPDLKLTRHGAVIFVHGCFWHGHDCEAFRLPSSNLPFWLAKIQANRERDLRAALALREAGWRVCVVWECALRGRRDETASRNVPQGRRLRRLRGGAAGRVPGPACARRRGPGTMSDAPAALDRPRGPCEDFACCPTPTR